MNNRIVFTTYGSLGDLYPYMAIAVELKQRGHQVAIATSEGYRSLVESENLEFHPIRPDFPAPNSEEGHIAMKQAMDAEKGTEYVFRQLIFPYLKDTYNDLMQVIKGGDLLITHHLSFASALVGQKTDISWVSSVLAPISFLSPYDPPVLGNQISRIELGLFSAPINRFLKYVGKLSIFSWSSPLQELWAELGLSPSKDPFFEDQQSPELILALFSQVFAQPQKDWYKQTCITGFPFYDRQAAELSPELFEFLKAGTPPIVFTLGSAAVNDAGNFYIESAIAAKQLGCRAVLIIGEDTRNQLPENLLSTDTAFFS